MEYTPQAQKEIALLFTRYPQWAPFEGEILAALNELISLSAGRKSSYLWEWRFSCRLRTYRGRVDERL